MLNGGADNIGLRLTGDPSGLQRALAQGGQAVEQFGAKAQQELDRVGDSFDKAGQKGISFQQVLALFTAREVGRFTWRAMTGELSQFEGAMQSAQITAQKLQNTLTFAVGRDAAARDLTFLRDTTKSLGLEFVTTAQQYARLAASSRGTAMEGAKTRDLFEAIAQASAVMGLSVDESEGSFRAVQQMMSKGKVQAEELRGQLGERLPGAFQIAARAMGVTTGQLDKMLETGQVMADDFLPKFAEQLKKELAGSVNDAGNSAQAASNRWKNAFTELQQALADAGLANAIAKRQEVIADSFSTTAQAMREAKAEGAGFFGQLFAGFAADIGLRNPLTGISASARDNAEELKNAKLRLQELQAQGDVLGSNIYWRSEKAEVEEYIARLEAALAKKKAITETHPEDAYYNYTSRSQSYANDERRRAQDRASLDGIRAQLSGQGQNYQRNLSELYRLRQTGDIPTDDAYRDLVKQLIDQQGGIKKTSTSATPGDTVLKSISERTAELRQELEQQQDLTSAQKLAAKVLDDLRTGTLKLSEAEKVRMGGALNDLLTTDKQNVAREKAVKLADEQLKVVKQNVEAAEKEVQRRIKATEQESERNDKLAEEIKLIGYDDKSRTQLLQTMEMEHIKRLELDLANAVNIEGNDKMVDAIEREIAVRKRRLALLGDKGDAEAINKVIQENKKDAEHIADALTEHLLRGGRSFWQYMKDAARATVLTPIIKAGVNWGMNALGMPTSMAAYGGSPGVLGMANSANSAYNLYSTGSSVYTVGSQYAAGTMSGANAAGTIYGNATGAGLDGLLATNGAYGTAAGAGGAAGAGAGAAAAEGGAAAAGAEGATAGSGALAGMGPWGWAAIAGIAIASYVGGRGEQRFGAEYTNGNKLRGPSGGELAPDQVHTAIQGTTDSINQGIRALGGTQSVGTLYSGMESSGEGKGFAYAGAQLSNGVVVGQGGPSMADLEAARFNRRGDKSAEQALAEYFEELKQTTLQALQASDIKGELADYIRSLGNIDQLTGPALDAAYNRVAKAVSERTALEQRLAAMADESTSALDKLNKQRDAERAAIDSTNRALLEQVYAQEDLATAQANMAGLRTNLLDAYSRESQAMEQSREALQQTIDGHHQAAQELRDIRDSLRLGENSPIAPEIQTSEARAQFESILSGARPGDVGGAANTYLDRVLANASSEVEFRAAFATVDAQLAEQATKEDAAATLGEQQLAVADQQLAVMKDQLTQLQVLDTNLQTFAQALAAYQAGLQAVEDAKAKVEQEKAAVTTSQTVSTVAVPTKPVLSDADKNAIMQSVWDRFGFVGNEPTGFAGGGMHLGGLRIVGEEGPELEATGPARIFNARQTQEILAGAAGGGDQVAQLRELAARMDRQQAALEAIATSNALAFKVLEEIQIRGVQLRESDAGELPQVRVVA